MILNNDVVIAIERLHDSSHILKFLEKLELYPATPGDHFEMDVNGRPIQLKVLKRHVLLYYRDPFANETRILDLLRAENL